MTGIGRITSYPNNPRVWKSQITAACLGLEVEVNTEFEFGVHNKKESFLSKFPLGKIPVMETPQGPLYESDAIAFYVANYVRDSPLLGATNYERSVVLQYIMVAAHEYAFHVGKWLYPILGYLKYDKKAEEEAKERLDRALLALDKDLLNKTFLAGERVTLADINAVCSLFHGFTQLFDAPYRAKIPNVTRWFVTCVNQPAFAKVLGAVSLCEKTAVYDESKAKEAAAPKQEKKKEKPAAKPEVETAASIEDEVEAELKGEKKKNPLDLLPPSEFILDAWKRFYSNNDPPQAIEYFWQNYDPQGYSLWKVDYKYNQELGAVFMSSNLIGGFFQRLDKARKYAFGSMIVTGEANNNQISGYFIFRGQEVPFEVTDAADYDSYEFVKVDSADEKVRAAFNDYLSWEGPNLPGKFADGKIFK